MSMKRMSFLLVLGLVAAAAAPAAAADRAPAQATLADIFAELAPSSIAPAPALQPGVKAEARSSCSPEGAKMWIWNGSCCIAARQSQDQYVCTGGAWVPTGSTRCFFPTCGP